MFVSVIIPSYNKEKRLGLVLHTLGIQNCGMERFEVIVVDDGSTDHTRDIVRSYQKSTSLNIEYLYQLNKGRSAARNGGIRMAKGDIIIFLDDDRIVRENFINEHLRFYINKRNMNFVVLGKRMCLFLSNFEVLFQEYQRIIQKNPEELFKKAREEHYYWKKAKSVTELAGISWMSFVTGNLSVGADLIRKVGLFDEGFQGWGYEDIELGYRLWKEGTRFFINEAAINYHLEHLRNRRELEEDIARNRTYLLNIHPEFPMQYYVKFIEGKMNPEEVNRMVINNNFGFG
jgi:glycosyltransferase involved in cell wall biosynthesis